MRVAVPLYPVTFIQAVAVLSFTLMPWDVVAVYFHLATFGVPSIRSYAYQLVGNLSEKEMMAVAESLTAEK